MSTLIKSSQSITGTASDRVEELKNLIESISLIDYHEAGDVIFYDTVNNKKVFASADSDFANDYPASQYTPIGVVAIPNSHDVYGNGKCGVMSLGWMSCSSPDTGSSSASNMYWGQYNVDTSLSNLNTANSVGSISYSNNYPSTNTLSNTITSNPVNACLPSDNNGGVTYSLEDPLDSNSYYGYLGSYTAAPGPYITDGSRNPLYYQTESPAVSTNCLSDFDGVGNTSTLLELATAQSDWKTAETITNNSGEGYSPAACCCWRYHTDGTSQGDWYLPSCGELGYAYARYKAISNSITTLASIYSNIPIGISTNAYIWTSTEYSSTNARGIYFYFGSSYYSGSVYGYGKGSLYYCVRAFLRV